MNTDFKVIGSTRLGIKPDSMAPEADALITRTSDQLNITGITKQSENENGGKLLLKFI